MLHRLCGAPVNSFDTARVDTHAPSIHRLRLDYLGYLIPFAPLAFVSQCQCRPSKCFRRWCVLSDL
ncbi:hypothetical protein HID58_096115 [Brassica napus]|uniref:Uncharacterized protein n=1 Tax=Brassica napus TaxID=3708 RepID=A0ABQ7X3S5_BRANA|nr:hypothetical protein HID58_096115 [Brassica napus]